MKPIRGVIITCLFGLFVCTTHVFTSGNVQTQKPKKITNALECIPEPKMEEISRIRIAEEWPNPTVVVNSDSFYLIVFVEGERLREELNLADLEKRLKELKLERWPLGRVIALHENSLRNLGDNEKITAQGKQVKQMLQSHKVMIELWPSG